MDEAEAEVAELSVDEEPSSVAEEDDCDDEPVDSLIEEVQREEVERESNGLATEEAAARADSDQELDELLDESLGEFGKLLTQDKPLQAAQSVTSDPTSGTSASSGAGPPTSSSGDSFEEIFSEEFAAEAEAQLNEAMEMLASENPELWQQFESFAKSMGMETAAGGGASTSQATPTTNGAASASKEDTSVDEGASKERGGAPDLDAQLEETLKRLRETTEQIEQSGVGSGLGDMFGQLDLGSEEGEDQLMKMMQGMMSTLLSKEVLYPSLKELCKQYPDWLKRHSADTPQADLDRYTKQLELMNTICSEFESQPEGERAAGENSEKIMQLMQQLQQYGQPPEGLAGDNLQQVGLPPGLLSSGPSSCSLM